MSEPLNNFEKRSRELFQDSVDNLDMRIRSRLTQARHAALDEAGGGRRFAGMHRSVWAPAAGVTAMAILAVGVRLGSPLLHPATMADGRSNLEDLELVAAADENAVDAVEMLQDDIDFYDFADRVGSSESGA